MKKHWLWGVLLILGLGGCEDRVRSDKGGAVPDLRGVWDFILLPGFGPAKEYAVTVERPGGSGTALVSISGPLTSDTTVVTAESALNVGECGVTMTFGDTTGFYLAAGDRWNIRVVNGSPDPPTAGNTVDSVVGAVTAGGRDGCAAAICQGSALGSAVPQAGRGITGQSQGSQWLSVRLAQSGSEVSGYVAEQHALSLYLGTVLLSSPPLTLPPLLNPGEFVTISFRRRAAADGEAGDFFRVMVVNGPDLSDAEYLYGPAMTGGDTVVNFSFTALTSEVRVDFVTGLSGTGEVVEVDEVKVTAGGAPVFQENFEAGPGSDCGPSGINFLRWEPRNPEWAAGRLCVSAAEALAGDYSMRWEGGSSRRISGFIITASSLGDLGELMGGLGGLLGGISALSGLFLETWETQWTNFLTTFSVASPASGGLAGTFRGESRDHACVEIGELTAVRHQTRQTDLSTADWILRIEGKGINCSPAPLSGNTIAFGDTLSTASGDTIRLLQVGTAFIASENPLDNFGNVYRLSGQAGGSLLTINLVDPAGRANAVGLGRLAGDRVEGVLTGRLLFDSGRLCELAEDATFRVLLVGK